MLFSMCRTRSWHYLAPTESFLSTQTCVFDEKSVARKIDGLFSSTSTQVHQDQASDGYSSCCPGLVEYRTERIPIS